MIVFSVTAGVLVGIIAGLLPGLNVTTGILILTPWLLTLPTPDIIVFYISAMIISQFTGSVSAVLFGVPGEVSSLPTVQESSRIRKFEITNTVIAGNAIGSAVGGLLAVGITMMSLYGIGFFYGYFNHLIQSVIMLSIISLLIFTGSNRLSHNIALVLGGIFLSFIGLNSILDINFLTFGNPYLEQGLPIVAVMISLFAIPVVLQSFLLIEDLDHNQDNKKINWSMIVSSVPTMLRSSGLGWLLGLIPGMSYAYSSTAGYSAERWFEKNKTLQQITLNRVIASEVANNAGVISCLIPFLIFGIPIINSEIAIVNLINQKTVLNFDWVLNNSTLLWTTVLMATFAGLIAAWPMSRLIAKLMNINRSVLKWILLTLLTLSVLYIGYSQDQFWYYTLSFLALLPIGLWLRKLDTLPLVFTTIFFDSIFNVLYRTWIIYS